MSVTIDAAARELADIDPTAQDARLADTMAPPSSNGNTPPPNVDPETGEITGPPPPNLPESFYEERRELAHIRDAAHSAARSADAVLGATLAHVSALTPHTLRLPAPVGTPGTLDVVVGLVGPSGAGKSSSTLVADELIPIPSTSDVAVVPLGSGEGVVEAYWGTVEEIDDHGKAVKVRRQVRHAALFMLDEGQALAEMSGRNGSTLAPTIRTGWSGGRLGQANASEERRRHLLPGEYRFALVAGWQTEYATALLDDAAGGTPQRFLFFAAADPTIPDEAPPRPGRLEWRPPTSARREMALDAHVAAEIRGRALAHSRGAVIGDPLDSHRDLSRLKVAGLLAVLAGRVDVDAADWRLAGMVLDSSDRVRAMIVRHAAARALEAQQGDIRRHVNRATAVDRSAEHRALTVMAKAIGRHVHRDKCEGCARRCVSRSTPGKYRAVVTIDDAIDEAAGQGWIVVDGDEIRPGESRPT